MSEQLNCPFCGVTVHPMDKILKTDPGYRHPDNKKCPLTYVVFTPEQWAMRPPQQLGTRPKEHLIPAMPSEVEYLRSIVERLALRDVPLSYSNSSERADGEIYAIRSGTGPSGDLLKPIGPGGRVE